MVQEFCQRENMPATYTSQDLPESWSTETATAIYRIAQEALRNVSKHAGKTHVKVSLSGIDNQLQLRIMDFGLGFDQDADGPARGLGMISMKERARLAGGTLTVQSDLGHGTTVTATVPLRLHA
jgi:two-component system CheB/CheR fusion protein